MVELLWKTTGISPQKLNIELPYNKAISFLGTYPREMKAYIHIKRVHECSCIINNSQKVKEPKCPESDGWINERVHTHNEILFGHKKQWCSDMCYNISKPWKHYAKKTSQSQKTVYGMIPFIWNIQKRWIYRDRN